MGAFTGLVVSIAGEPTSYQKESLIAEIERQGGIYQRSPENVHVLVIGDDPGDRPWRAKQANPDLYVLYADFFWATARNRKTPIVANPRLFPGQEDRERETTYGSF